MLSQSRANNNQLCILKRAWSLVLSQSWGTFWEGCLWAAACCSASNDKLMALWIWQQTGLKTKLMDTEYTLTLGELGYKHAYFLAQLYLEMFTTVLLALLNEITVRILEATALFIRLTLLSVSQALSAEWQGSPCSEMIYSEGFDMWRWCLDTMSYPQPDQYAVHVLKSALDHKPRGNKSNNQRHPFWHVPLKSNWRCKYGKTTVKVTCAFNLYYRSKLFPGWLVDSQPTAFIKADFK